MVVNFWKEMLSLAKNLVLGNTVKTGDGRASMRISD